MDNLLKLGIILAPAGYFLLYAGSKRATFDDTAKLMGVGGVLGAFTGGFILLFFCINVLIPGVQSFSALTQFFFMMLVLAGAAAPIFFFLKRIQSATE